MELFSSSRQAPLAEVAARTAASKLSNGCALLVHELAREPAKGLLHVVVRPAQRARTQAACCCRRRAQRHRPLQMAAAA